MSTTPDPYYVQPVTYLNTTHYHVVHTDYPNGRADSFASETEAVKEAERLNARDYERRAEAEWREGLA